MARITAALLLAALLLAACSADPERAALLLAAERATQTADVAQATATRDAWQAQTTATADALQMEIVRGIMAQTAQAAQVQATAQAQEATAEARRLAEVQSTQAAQAAAAEATAESMANRIKATEAAAAQETARAWQRESWQATASAAAWQATAQAQAAEATASATVTAAALAIVATREAADAQAHATAQAAAAGEAAAAVQRTQITNEAAAWWRLAAWPLYAAALLLAALAAWRLWSNTRIIGRDKNGAAPVIIHDGQLINADLMTLPWHDPRRPILLSEAAHVQAADNNAKVRAIQALPFGGGNAPAQSLAAAFTPTAQAQAAQMITQSIPDRAAWNNITDRRPAGMLLLGAGADGPIRARQDTPHILLAGQTGSGKSTEMRSLITQYLLDGARVTILDKSGRDFAVFDRWATVITIDASDPGRAVAALISNMRAAWNEVIRRQRAARPTWQGVTDLLVVDELDNWQDVTADGETTARRLWQYPRMIAREGRASGIYLLVASQNPTAANISLDLRRNCTPVAFRLADPIASNTVIGSPDAVNLATGQFITRLGDTVRGMAYNPTDADIIQTLERGRVRLAERPEWLTQAEQAQAEPTTQAEQARRLAAEGKTPSAIAAALFGYSNGRAIAQVSDWLSMSD